MNRKNWYILFSLLIVLFGYFWWRSASFLDPDFGWHLRMGQFILAKGIPATDPFSYTMSSYPFVDHEWLTNVVFARGFATVGYVALGGVFALLGVVAFALQLVSVSQKAKKFWVVFLFLALIAVSGSVGIRPQLITWFFFSLVLLVIRDQTRFLRYGWLLPLLMLVWVNLHGGFALGIVALFLASVYWGWKLPQKRLQIGVLFVATSIATFAMPYGIRGWWEVWMQMTDGSLRWTIQEWVPTIFVPNMPLWLFIIFSSMFVGRYFKKFTLLDLLLYGGLLVAALSSIRHAPLWLLVALPMTIESVNLFYTDVAKIPHGTSRFWLMGKIFLVIIAIFCLQEAQMIYTLVGLNGKQATYPEQAVKFLKTHNPPGQVFAPYDWGGYLIWKLPLKKVFIDGRMPSWRWQANKKGESNYAFVDYRNFSDGKVPFETVITKYGIQTLLLPVPPPPAKDALTLWLKQVGNKTLGLKLRDEVAFSKVVAKSKKAGWKVIYQDETAVIYQKVK